MSSQVLDKLCEMNRQRSTGGIYSVCSAHPLVLEASFLKAIEHGTPLLVEATCNQVNQDGGYTGKTPQRFRDDVLAIAKSMNFPTERLILGGDHLGPTPWSKLTAEEAMQKAEAMVAAYAAAGFEKLHLDASMPCADDPEVLNDAIVAERAVRLCRAAEAAAAEAGGAETLRYIIGTEVPVPGGAHEEIDELAVTGVEDLNTTIETHRQCFMDADMNAAWKRVIAVVVQPGVEFGNTEVIDFIPEKAVDLSQAVLDHPRLVFEAHSTDYQTPVAYQQLVKDHFAILKVGPALTFAMREALYALENIVREAPELKTVQLRATLESLMQEDPKYWKSYYSGSSAQQMLERHYSLSDRIRYYWSAPAVVEQLELLLSSFKEATPPLTLVSQYMPKQYAAIREGELSLEPRAMVQHYIGGVIEDYSKACFQA